MSFVHLKEQVKERERKSGQAFKARANKLLSLCRITVEQSSNKDI